MPALNTLILDISCNPRAVKTAPNSESSTANCVKLVDITDNLVTADPTKVLSAAQGVELKRQIDVVKADISKIIVSGIGVSGGNGVKVTSSGDQSIISLKVSTNSALGYNDDGELTIKWEEELK